MTTATWSEVAPGVGVYLFEYDVPSLGIGMVHIGCGQSVPQTILSGRRATSAWANGTVSA